MITTAAELYTALVPEQTVNSNTDLNAVDSQYAALYGHNTTSLIQKMLHHLIYRAAPQQFYDLNILGLTEPEQVNSDEFSYMESQYAREPVIVASAYAGGGSSAVITVSPASMEAVSIDTVLVFPNNQKGTVTAVNPITNQLTINCQTGQTMPAFNLGDSIGNLSSVEMDGANTISQYFRLNVIERYNFVQQFVKAIRFGEVEMFKYMKAGTTNYIAENRFEMENQFRIDLSNAFWNGTMGEVTLASGGKAKTMGGIFPTMQEAGSYSVLSSAANLQAAVEDLALNTEYGPYGQTRFLYATPKWLLALSKLYRSPLQRYLVGDTKAELSFEGINMGSTKILFVPMKRFESNADFPAAFANRMILLNHDTIKPCSMIGERKGNTANRATGGTYNKFVDEWMDATFSIKFNNPSASGWIDITP